MIPLWPRQHRPNEDSPRDLPDSEQGVVLAQVLTSQFEIELARLDRNLTRLGRFQTSATVPLVVLSAAAAVSQGAALRQCGWIALAVSALLLVLSLGISIIAVAEKGGVAALNSGQLKAWLENWERSNAELRKYQCKALLDAIKTQEVANEYLRKAWVRASVSQAAGLTVALIVMLGLLLQHR